MSRLFGNGNLETRAEGRQRFVAELLLLVCGVARLRRTQTVALHCFRQDDRGSTLMLHRSLVSVIHLLRIVAAAMQAVKLVVAHVGDQLEQRWIFPEELLADIRAALGLEILVLAVHALFHALQQEAGTVERK